MVQGNRVLGLATVTFIAVGFTIGAGVFVFTGIVAKIAGAALPVAYALAAIPVFVSMLPIGMLGATLPLNGGNYRYPSRMVSPGVAFVGIWVYILASFIGQIPLYAISCARYAALLVPALPQQGFAVLILTLFFLTNLFGLRLAAVIQGVMVVILVAVLLFYSGSNLTCFDASHFDGLLTGHGNLALGSALLSFTYFGANGIIELGGEITQPQEVIPRALFIAFPLVLVIYLLVSISTVGVMPADALAAQREPLIGAFEACAGQGSARALVIVGGAILALTTTLNALFLVGTKSLQAIIDDRILPAFLGAQNKRFGTAHHLLTLLWALSVLGVLSSLQIETFASYAALGATMVFFPVLLAALRLPSLYPEAYARSAFKLRGLWLWSCPIVGFLVSLFFCAVILADLGTPAKVAPFFGFMLSGVVLYVIRKRQLRRQGHDLAAIVSERLDDCCATYDLRNGAGRSIVSKHDRMGCDPQS